MHTEDASSPSALGSSKEPDNSLPAVDGDTKLSSDTEAKQSDAWIRYSIEWQDPHGVFKSRHEVSEQDAEQDVGDTSRNSLPAFERVSVFRTKHDIETDAEKGKTEEKALSLTGATPTYHLRIYSVAIIHALRSVVQYYPAQDLSGDVIEIDWPYPVLVHHYDELRSFREACANKEPSEACVRERHLGRPLELLLGFLDKEVMDSVNAEKERNKRGYATFDYLWVAHKPGTTMMYQESEVHDWKAAIVYSITGGTFTQPRRKWTVWIWSMEHNGSLLGRVEHSINYDRFDGEESYSGLYMMILSDEEFESAKLENEVVKQTIEYESFARLNHHGKVLSQELWTADFVEGKGNGLIFLLHGGPGVGKTFTAECIAHSLERPLMVLTTSDIGTFPEAVEKRLARNFKTAKSWNAVLLIDEADVFLAQRSIGDLHRSSLVASFLRALEFYDGILFLTTNRVGTFDDAILSRVHIQLFYPDLDEDQRYKMWMTFINKLEADRPSMQIKYALKEYLRSSEIRDFKMNGREIRNGELPTRPSLHSEHRAEEGEGGKTLLTEEHLREVVELYRSFKLYFSELHGSEGKRALDRGERLDSFIKAIKENF
ncbi:hypothetical protein DL764_010597 [Monosporascus ibericus]|uniref:AAA+ ATPase domain-containing protein n=1 Tax=Monosporascus ibericus TaxID=155417 RepID=A0A4Q4SSG1_9PEZI|nr:hypothetical protein DL764_010597 [Monosporascus ibericus]